MQTVQTTLPIVEKKSKRSISSIIRGKILDGFENNSFGEIAVKGMLTIVSIFLTFIFSFTDLTAKVLHRTFTFQNYMLIKGVIMFYTVFNFSQIRGFIRRLFAKEKKPSEDTIEGIPTSELLDHLSEYKSFKRDEIEGKFGVSRNRYTILAQKLEELGVLVRGENNSRVVNSNFTREDIAQIIVGKQSAVQLQHTMRTLVQE